MHTEQTPASYWKQTRKAKEDGDSRPSCLAALEKQKEIRLNKAGQYGIPTTDGYVHCSATDEAFPWMVFFDQLTTRNLPTVIEFFTGTNQEALLAHFD